MELWLDVGAFGLKALILLIVVLVLLAVVSNLVFRFKGIPEQLDVEDLGAKFKGFSRQVRTYFSDLKALKKELKQEKKQEKKKVKKPTEPSRKIFVIDFDGDMKASQVETLRQKVTTILMVADPDHDEVVLRLSSPGGMVHTYGLAAAQLLRFKNNKLKLTVCVDKVAASGGYLMACTADRIIASPFAIVGSIGVLAQIPNFHRLLKKNDVDYEEITAGEFKRTLSVFGEITEKGRQKFSEQIEATHSLFKDFVKQYRPQLDMQLVATGEYWYGTQAVQLGLVDEIQSSDDYLFEKYKDHKVLKIEIEGRKKLSEKLADSMSLSLDRLLMKWWQRASEKYYL